jgi:uncharacterized protein
MSRGKLITVTAYESYNYCAAYKRVGGVAGIHRGEVGYFPGPTCPRSVDPGKSEQRPAFLHAPGRESRGTCDTLITKRIHAVVKAIADTGFLVAFANRRDRHHDWAVQLADQLTEPLFTCEAVLAEAAYQLQDTSLVLAMLREGLVALAFDCNDHLPQLEELARRFHANHDTLFDLSLKKTIVIDC